MAIGEASEYGRELRHIVALNEEVKRIVKTAFRINLMAMNAIFLAKRAGHSALGFGVLSQELCRFAAELEQQMRALGLATAHSVAAATATLKETHLLAAFRRTRAQCQETGQASLDRALHLHGESRLSECAEQVSAFNRSHRMMIDDAVRLIEMGGVLARSAKIEAAYGGNLSQALRQVSGDFEATIGDIRESLNRLRKLRLDGPSA